MTTDFISTNKVKANPLPGQAKTEKRVFLSQDHKAKPFSFKDDPRRYSGVITKPQKVGLPALQTQDLRTIAERKKTIMAMTQKAAAKPKAAARKAGRPVGSKGKNKKSK